MGEFVASIWVEIDVLEFVEVNSFFDLSDFEEDNEVLGSDDLTGRIADERVKFGKVM